MHIPKVRVFWDGEYYVVVGADNCLNRFHNIKCAIGFAMSLYKYRKAQMQSELMMKELMKDL